MYSFIIRADSDVITVYDCCTGEELLDIVCQNLDITDAHSHSVVTNTLLHSGWRVFSYTIISKIDDEGIPLLTGFIEPVSTEATAK